MKVFVNGFWHGFQEKTNGVHFGFFESLLNTVFQTTVTVVADIYSADLLLESHFASSLLPAKQWEYSVFFSGEASIPLPPHADNYTLVLGAQSTEKNHVRCPLFVVYDACKPAPIAPPSAIPTKGVCVVISSTHNLESRYRFEFLQILEDAGIAIDYGGKYKNNVGAPIAGEYYEAPMIEFYSQYRVVLALENTVNDNYITEKILNPLRAKTVPVYFGSACVNEYVTKDRIVTVNQSDPAETVTTIKRLLHDDVFWYQKASATPFVKPLTQVIATIVEECKIVVQSSPYVPFVIGNVEKEPERTERLSSLLTHFRIVPQAETYGDPSTHPFYNKFSTHLNNPMISLAINHVTILKKVVNKNKFALLFESDVLPLSDFTHITAQLCEIIESMKTHNLDFVFLGKGCVYDAVPGDKPFYPPCLYKESRSRCTESYLVSPQGIQKYLKWFYANNKHDAIDWDYNHFFQANATVQVAWAIPELFEQGTQKGIYKSRVTF